MRISRRMRRAVLAGGAAALAWGAAEQAAGSRAVRAASLLVIGAAAGGIAGSRASVKAYDTKQRLDTIVPRVPFPQPTPGVATNNSFGPANTTFAASNTSYSIRGGNVGFNATTLNKLYAAFDVLQDTVASIAGAYNTHVTDHGNFVNCVATLRADHSNLLSGHNTTVTKLGTANVFH